MVNQHVDEASALHVYSRYVQMYIHTLYICSSGTSLIRISLGQKKVSQLVRCPDFRGYQCTHTGCLGQQNMSMHPISWSPD